MSFESFLSRLTYIGKELWYYTMAYFSRLVNLIIFNGTMHQTLSARTHTEAHFDEGWKRQEEIINKIFFWEPNHCEKAWEDEVCRANKTLSRNYSIELLEIKEAEKNGTSN